MQDLQDFKNDIMLILSKDRLDTYDSLEQYKENLKLISFITPKISNLEIYLRNALDHCLTQIKGSDWVFNESALTPLIKELKEKKKEITHSLILSKMSLRAGLGLCSGGIFGLNESWEDRIEMLRALASLSPHTTPINFFIKNPVLPIEAETLSADEALECVLLAKEFLPNARLMVAGGREVVFKDNDE
ncbi:hypothetical protein ACOWL5_07910, partial [Helicobacter pylori]